MAWVHFTGDFTFRKPNFSIAYKAGMTLNVKAECAEQAVSRGAAFSLPTPRRGERPVINGNESENSGAGSVDAQAQPDGTKRE